MSFLNIESKTMDYVDIEFIEAMQCIHLQDFSFKPIKELPIEVIQALPPRSSSSTKSSNSSWGSSSVFGFKNAKVMPVVEEKVSR